MSVADGDAGRSSANPWRSAVPAMLMNSPG